MLGAVGVYDYLIKITENTVGVDPEMIQKYLSYNAYNDSNFLLVGVGKPKSRGYIRLKDSNPNSSPIIDPRYFSDEKGEDMQVLLEGIDFIVNLYENTTTYRKLGARLAPNHLPGCEMHQLKSRAYWECFARSIPQTMYHPSGTCPMGKSNDPNAVLDSKLRVLGTKNLRVCDASSMPVITNANTNAPSIAIGEICADLILKSVYEKENKAG